MSKVILIDTSMLFVPTVKIVNRIRQNNAEKGIKTFTMQPCSMYFNSLISCLKKIGVQKEDIIIMALEGHSFRKKLYAPYKAQRKGLRDKDTFVDWDKEYKNLNKLHDELDKATNWHFLRVADGLEADDIIAISCRYFKDKECVIVTGDKDIYMLAHYPNVKIFSTTKKCKGSKGIYVEVKNPLKILADKARNGDASDNIIVDINDTYEDAQLRYDLVNLLKLPDNIEKKGIEVIQNNIEKSEKCFSINTLKSDKMKEKLLSVYNKEFQITPEYCFKLQEKRDNKKKKLKGEK